MRWLEANAEAATQHARAGGTGALVLGGARPFVARTFAPAVLQVREPTTSQRFF